MNAAIVENGIVTNVIVVDDINFMPGLVEIPEGKFIHIGDNIDNMVDIGVTITKNNAVITSSETTPTVV
jgi:hypothetical protein